MRPGYEDALQLKKGPADTATLRPLNPHVRTRPGAPINFQLSATRRPDGVQQWRIPQRNYWITSSARASIRTLSGKARDIGPWSGQTCDQVIAYRVSYASDYDGDGRCCLLHRHDGLVPRRDIHIDFKVYKLDGDVRIMLNASFPHRYSIAMSRSSIQPSSRSRWRKAANHGSPAPRPGLSKPMIFAGVCG